MSHLYQNRIAQRGLSIIEIVITLAVLAILIGLGLPSFDTWLQNTTLRSAAVSLRAALVDARGEAIRRNSNAELVLSATDVTPAAVGTVTPAASGSAWVVRARDLVAAGAPWVYAGGQSASETKVIVATSTAGTVGFDSIGRIVGGASVTFDVTPSNPLLCRPAGTLVCLRVVVTASGDIRTCDPIFILPGDTRAC